MHTGRNLPEELRPVDAARVADDIDPRQPASLDQVVAVARRLDPAHQTDLIAQLAADADTVVVELVEELQDTGLQCGSNTSTAAAYVGNARHGSLADEMSGAIARGGLQAGIEGDR